MSKLNIVIGGTGTLGKALVKKLYSNHENIIVLSRDEYKQSLLKKEFPNVVCRVCDIRSKRFSKVVDSLYPSYFTKFEINVYHCAALKRVDIGEFEVEEFVETNYNGLINSYETFKNIANKFIFFTTDKAVMPINAYGMTKGLAEKYLASMRGLNKCEIEIYRWGNILGSRGSLIETLVTNAIKDVPTMITAPHMSRFWYKIDDAIDFVLSEKSLKQSVYVPEDMKSAFNDQIIEAVNIILEGSGVEHRVKTTIGSIRPGEKMHESLSLDPQENSLFCTFLKIEELVEYIKPAVYQTYKEVLNKSITPT